MKINRILTAALLAAACLPATATRDKASLSEDEVILHAWSWSFDTIAANMADIAAAGYTYVQTSPAQACYVGEDGGMADHQKIVVLARYRGSYHSFQFRQGVCARLRRDCQRVHAVRRGKSTPDI